MQLWEDFVAAVERGQAKSADEGGPYDILWGTIRALHDRVAALEHPAPAPAEGEASPATE